MSNRPKEIFNLPPHKELLTIRERKKEDGTKETEVEIKPSKSGAAAGAAIGAPFGPAGMAVGALIGGIFGPK